MRQWCQNTWPELYRYLYYWVQNREEAEDLTQEIYARALSRFTFTQEFPTVGYLKTIGLNLVRDRWRRQKVQGVQVDLEERLLSCQSEEEAALNKNLVRELLAQLPEEQRKVIELRILQGYSRAETAQRLGKSQDAVRGLQYRAVKTLRSLMLKSLEEVD